MIELAETDEEIHKATANMAKLVRQSLKSTESPNGNARYDGVITQMRAFREEMVEVDMGEIYNEFCRDLKKRIFNEEFGDQRNFWAGFKFQKLGLIRGKDSEVTEQEAGDFLKSG